MKGKISPAPGAAEVDADLVEVEETTERWSEYRLEDGSVFKLRPIVTEVWRIVGDYDPEGNPKYVIKSQMVVAVRADEKLKKGLVS